MGCRNPGAVLIWGRWRSFDPYPMACYTVAGEQKDVLYAEEVQPEKGKRRASTPARLESPPCFKKTGCGTVGKEIKGRRVGVGGGEGGRDVKQEVCCQVLWVTQRCALPPCTEPHTLNRFLLNRMGFPGAFQNHRIKWMDWIHSAEQSTCSKRGRPWAWSSEAASIRRTQTALGHTLGRQGLSCLTALPATGTCCRWGKPLC